MFHLRVFGILTVALLASSIQVYGVSHTPRMTVTEGVTFKSIPKGPGHNKHIELLEGPEAKMLYYAAGSKLFTVDFRSLTPVEFLSTVLRKDHSDCTSPDCQYNITVLHKMNATNQLLICGTNGEDALCCHMNMTSTECTLSEDLKPPFEAWEPSLLIDFSDFYTTKSGTKGELGIHRLGNTRTRPKDSQTEQKYLRLAVSGPRDNQLEDKLYAFYIEKNPESILESTDRELWVPRVAQICLADLGGNKMYSQFLWTSQLRAQLACGDPSSRQYFTMLVDVVTFKAKRWQDTRVYTLFRNIW